jgi:hypothetical protein
MMNMISASTPSTNNTGWTIAPPAIAITSKTIPKINHSIGLTSLPAQSSPYPGFGGCSESELILQLRRLLIVAAGGLALAGNPLLGPVGVFGQLVGAGGVAFGQVGVLIG